jgi:hypothetical protein
MHGMIRIPGDTFRVASDRHDPEEVPAVVPDGWHVADICQGNFPEEADGYARTSPARAFPADGCGVHDDRQRVGMDGRPVFGQGKPPMLQRPTAFPRSSRIPTKVLKDGSHLCAPNYCRRYRPPARHADPPTYRRVTSGSAAS